MWFSFISLMCTENLAHIDIVIMTCYQKQISNGIMIWCLIIIVEVKLPYSCPNLYGVISFTFKMDPLYPNSGWYLWEAYSSILINLRHQVWHTGLISSISSLEVHHSWKSFVNHPTCDQKITSHGKPYIILYLLPKLRWWNWSLSFQYICLKCYWHSSPPMNGPHSSRDCLWLTLLANKLLILNVSPRHQVWCTELTSCHS